MSLASSRDRATKRLLAQSAVSASGGLAAEAVVQGAAAAANIFRQLSPGEPDDNPKVVGANARARSEHSPYPSLPEEGERRLAALEQRVDDRRRVQSTKMDDVHGRFTPDGFAPGLQEAVRQARQNLLEWTDRATAARAGHDILPDAHPTVIQARQNLAVAEEKLNRVQRPAFDRSATGESSFLSRIKPALASLPIVEDPEPPIPSKSDTVASLRNARAGKLVERQAIADAPEHSSTLKARVTAEVEALARRGEIQVNHDGRVVLPKRNHTIDVHAVGQSANGDAVNAIGFANDFGPDHGLVVIALNKDAIIRSLHQKIAESANDSRALSPEQRKGRLALIDGEILAIERKEAILIEEGGNAVPYRPDMSVAAFLCLKA